MIAHLQILFCAVLWGFAGPLIRWSALPVLSVVAIRFTLPLFFSYAWLRLVEKGKLHAIGRPLFVASVLQAIGNALFIIAFTFTSISNVLLLLYTRPVITTIFASLMLGEKVSATLWSLLAVAGFGALLIVTSNGIGLSNNDLIGMLMALGAATTIALAWAIIKKHGYGKRSNSEIVFYQNFFGAIIALPLLPYTLYTAPASGIAIMVVYCVVVGFIAIQLYFNGLRHVALSHAMPLTYAELVVAITIGVFFFGDKISWQMVVGGTLIILSSLGTLWARKATKVVAVSVS